MATFRVAASASAQSTALDAVPIVPSISIACTTLPVTITAASAVCAGRQRRGRTRRRSAASSAEAKTAHMASTPHGANGVGDRRSRTSITSGGLVSQRPATCRATAPTSAVPVQRCTRRPRGAGRPGR